jgi:hypothetical protein
MHDKYRLIENLHLERGRSVAVDVILCITDSVEWVSCSNVTFLDPTGLLQLRVPNGCRGLVFTSLVE